MGITEVRMVDTLLRLTGAHGEVTRALGEADIAWQENTALTKEAEERYKTMESQLQVLKNNVTDIGISIYQSLQEVMSESVSTLVGYTQRLKNAFSSDGFEGLVDTLGDVLADIIAKIGEALPEILGLGAKLITSFVDGILRNKENLMTTATKLIKDLATGISSSAGGIAKTGIEIINFLIEGITDTLPELIPLAIETILTFVDSPINNVDSLIDSAIEIINSLADGLLSSIPILLEKAPEIIQSLVLALIRNVPKLLGAAVEIVLKLVFGIFQNLPKLYESGAEIITSLIGGIANLIPTLVLKSIEIVTTIADAIVNKDWLSLGLDIIKGIGNGITNGVSWIKTKVNNVASDILNSFKEFFNIKSPSKLFADEIGKPIVQGIAVGIDKEKSKAIKAAEKLAKETYTSAKKWILQYRESEEYLVVFQNS